MRNISTVRRVVRDLEVRLARGSTERRVIFTRSYRTVIVLPKLVQAGSHVELFFTFPFETSLQKMLNITKLYE